MAPGNTHLCVPGQSIRLAGNENAGTEGGKHPENVRCRYEKAGQRTCLIHAAETARAVSAAPVNRHKEAKL